jgi:hypothetical protein
MISSPGPIYTATPFGALNAYHSIGAGKVGGVTFVAGGGTGPATGSAYSFSSDVATPAPGIPDVSPYAFEFFPQSGSDLGSNDADTDRLIQAGMPPNVFGLSGSYRDGGGVWQSAGTLPSPFVQVGAVTYVRSSGESTIVPVHQVSATEHVLGAGSGFGINDSCLMSLHGPLGVMFKADMAYINGYTPGVTTTVYEGDQAHPSMLTFGQRFFAARIVNNQLTASPFFFNDEKPRAGRAIGFSCQEISADGAKGMVISIPSPSGAPLLYKGLPQSTGLQFVSSANFPMISDSWGNSTLAFMHNFERDGVPDLILYPAEIPAGAISLPLHFYRGLKPITQ